MVWLRRSLAVPFGQSSSSASCPDEQTAWAKIRLGIPSLSILCNFLKILPHAVAKKRFPSRRICRRMSGAETDVVLLEIRPGTVRREVTTKADGSSGDSPVNSAQNQNRTIATSARQCNFPFQRADSPWGMNRMPTRAEVKLDLAGAEDRTLAGL